MESNKNVEELDVQAAMIQAILNGEADFDGQGFNTSVAGEESENVVENVAKVAVKKSKTQTKSKKQAKQEKQVDEASSKIQATRTSNIVPELSRFKDINRELSVNVVLYQHNIKYKNQTWNIPVREVEYQLELVTVQKEAKDIVEKFMAGRSEEDIQRGKELATAGKVRYMKIVSHANNIPYRARELGYIKLYYKEKQLKSRVLIATGICKENKINADSLMRKVGEQLTRLELITTD